MGEMVALEDTTGKHVLELSQSLMGGQIAARDIAAVLYHGLRGGGAKLSMDRVYSYMDDKPLLDWLPPVGELMTTALAGDAEGNDEAPGENSSQGSTGAE